MNNNKDFPKEHRMTKNTLLEKLAEIQPNKTLLEIKGKTILVIHELETAIFLAVQNAVTYVTDDYDAFIKFKGMTSNIEFGTDDHAYYVDGTEITWNNFIEKIEAKEIEGNA